MNRQRIEERITSYFGPARAALAAALSEVIWCFKCREYLAAVLRESGPDFTAEEALVQWAITRGQLWAPE